MSDTRSRVSEHIPGVSGYPFANDKFSESMGINTPTHPSATSLLPISSRTPLQAKKELSHSLSSILERFPWGIQVRVLQGQRFVLLSCHSYSWALNFHQDSGFKFLTLGALCSKMTRYARECSASFVSSMGNLYLPFLSEEPIVGDLGLDRWSRPWERNIGVLEHRLLNLSSTELWHLRVWTSGNKSLSHLCCFTWFHCHLLVSLSF